MTMLRCEALQMLIDTAGWEPRAFESAEEFLSCTHGPVSTCVVLDVNRPGLDGLELQKRLADRMGMPIIIITGAGDLPMCTAQGSRTRRLCRDRELCAGRDANRRADARCESAMSKRVAEVIVGTLQATGVKTCYGIVGDALNRIGRTIDASEIDGVHMRREKVRAFAEVVGASFTGRLTACAETRGPGSLYFINGFYEANRNSYPRDRHVR